MNVSNLNNISTLELNNTLLNDSQNIVPNLITNSNDLTGGYFTLGLMVVVFIGLLIIFMTERDVFRLKFSNALAGASGISLIMGIVLLISDIGSNFQHVMWFAILFVISLIIVYYDKN